MRSQRALWIVIMAVASWLLLIAPGSSPSLGQVPRVVRHGASAPHIPATSNSFSSATPYRAYLPAVLRSAAGTVELVFSFSQVVQPGADTRHLAVAFHAIQFIDAQARTLGTFSFGTPEANACQGQGWFANETWPDVGPFQWAGGPAKRATMQLPIPAGTEGLLLHLNSIRNGLWMAVQVNGSTSARLPVDAYWHFGYVPVGAAPLNDPLAPPPEWVEGRYFPRFSPADRVYAIHVRSVLHDWSLITRPDWRINSSLDTMMALTLVGMQGVINRNGAAVYLDWEDQGILRHPSGHWLALLRDHVEVVYLDLDSLSAFNFLYRRYASRFRGAVLYDPGVPDTINLATMLAGLEERIILAPEQLGLVGVPNLASVTDLRTLARQQRWDTTEDGKLRLYQWVYQNLWSRLDHRIIGLISPGPPTSREIAGAPGVYYAIGMPSRDYIVALRLSALWLSPVEEPQAGLLARFVQEAPSPVPVYGFFGNDEAATVALGSRYGDWNAVFTVGNSPLAVGSLTVLSAVRPDLQRYPAEIDTDRLFATMGQKPVLTLVSSDGDSTIFQMDRGFHGGVDFYWEGVQGHRFGWTINPTLVDLAPIVWNDYVGSRSEVSLVSGLSGCGYMYPNLMNDTQLRAYLTYAARYLQDTGLRVLYLETSYGPFLHALEGRITTAYYEKLRSTGYLGAFIGASGWPWGLGWYYRVTPVPIVPPSYVLRLHNRDSIIEDLLARRPGEYLVDLTGEYRWQEKDPGYGWQRGQVVADSSAHAGKALRFSRSDPYPPGLVVWGPYSALASGTYRVTYRLKVASRGESKPIAQLYVGTIEGSTWRTIAQRYVAPSEFVQAGEYQDFDVSFTLDQFATDLEFRLDYYGGMAGNWATTDLYADYIVARRQRGLDLPVCAAALIALVGPTEPLDDSMEITRDFERAGGLVLTPDEFMAMLNPEFLLQWATPILGADHSAVAQARQQLRNGRFLESLLTLRQALRTLPVQQYQAGDGITVSANAWITHLTFDRLGQRIYFRTHGPPEGTVQVLLILPSGLLSGPFALRVDGRPHPFAASEDLTHLSFTVAQGPHMVVVTSGQQGVAPAVVGLLFSANRAARGRQMAP